MADPRVVFPRGRCYRLVGTGFALVDYMPKKSLEERVAALEVKVGDKTLDERFREQAELIDRLFAYRFDEFDREWEAKLDARFVEFDRKWDAKLEAKFDEKLAPIQTDLAAVKDAVQLILTRLPKRR